VRQVVMRNLTTVGWAVFLIGLLAPWIAEATGLASRLLGAGAAAAAVLGLLLVYAGPRATWPKGDPKGYLSVALPALGLIVATVLAVLVHAPAPAAVIPYWIAIAFVGAFVVFGRRAWEPWSRYVLRRPRLGPVGAFRNRVLQQIKAVLDELLAIRGDPDSLRSGRARAEGFLDGMRAIPAPSSDWAAMRDAYARRLQDLVDSADTPAALDDALRAWLDDPDVGRLRWMFDQLSPVTGPEPERE
jgi:hypothetical protein